MRKKRPFSVLPIVAILVMLTACSDDTSFAAPANTPDVTVMAIEVATANALIASTTPAATQRPAQTSTAPPATSIPEPTKDSSTDASSTPSATTAVSDADYTVSAGDTLLSIALEHKVSMAAIMLKNNLDDAAVIQLGQTLKIPNSLTWTGENVFWSVYIVQAGETLLEIAQQNEVNMDDLVRINRIADAAAIQIGQKLVLPALQPGSAVNRVATGASKSEVGAQARQAPQAGKAPVVAARSAPAPVEPAVPVAPLNVTGADGIRAQLLAMYNQVRASYGVAPLTASGVLQLSAQLHAQDCAQRGYGSHVGSDGSTTRARTARAGFTGRITGENWVWSSGAAGAFNLWYNQESDGGPHRSNILSARYTQVGFGVAAANGGYYIIADFGAP
jgi:uncharacterized protein YkwD